MVPLVNPRRTAEIFLKYCFKPSKKLGQNFLIDANILDKIVRAADPHPEDVILEVGPGIGTLTEALAPRVKSVLAIEYDRRLVAILEETLKEFSNVRLANADVLKVDLEGLFPEIGQCSKMVSNLPYQIAAPLLIEVLENHPQVRRIVVMVQKEVADRLLAAPGNKNYGAFTLKVQYYSQVEMVARISRKVFIPEPNVDSTVVRMERRETPAIEVASKELLFNVITAAFEQRRKTLRNALSEVGSLRLSRSQVEEGLRQAGLDPRKRGEALSLADFGKLTNAFAQMAEKSLDERVF